MVIIWYTATLHMGGCYFKYKAERASLLFLFTLASHTASKFKTVLCSVFYLAMIRSGHTLFTFTAFFFTVVVFESFRLGIQVGWPKSDDPSRMIQVGWSKSDDPSRMTQVGWPKSGDSSQMIQVGWPRSDDPSRMIQVGWPKSDDPERMTQVRWPKSGDPSQMSKSDDPSRMTQVGWPKSDDPSRMTRGWSCGDVMVFSQIVTEDEHDFSCPDWAKRRNTNGAHY